ncbi:MAG: NAD(P)-dependent oxidoreductase [Pyrinomonadaceae bacterium]
MKIAIFGSTGSIGRELVKQALGKGYSVTAAAREPSKIDVKHENLCMVRADVMDKNAVESVVAQQDAILSALGTPALTRNTTRSQGTFHIIQAMEKLGVRRLISLSSLGVGDSRPMLPAFYKYILVPFLLRQGFADHEMQESYVNQSKVNWTIVRPGAYTNGKLTGVYKHGFPVTDSTIKAKISRADVADFMLKQLETSDYVRKSPGLSY